MKYNIQTIPLSDGRITQSIVTDEAYDVRKVIIQHVIDTQEEQVRTALISLGWTPPGAGLCTAINVPCAPSQSDPFGQATRRVTAADVHKMETDLEHYGWTQAELAKSRENEFDALAKVTSLRAVLQDKIDKLARVYKALA